MPEKETVERERRDAREGKSEEMEHIKEGKHPGSGKQVIAIGLSRAPLAGVKLVPPQRKAARNGRGSR